MAVTQYIGARYVPAFYENSDGTAEWRSGVIYEPLTIVTYNMNSYTSKKPVPAEIGNPSDNPSYWAATGMYNEQIASMQDRINEIGETIEKVAGIYVNVKDYGAAGDGITDDTSAILAAINACGNYDVLLFPNGEYLVSAQISIVDKFLTVLGFGATLKCAFTGNYVMDLSVSPTYDGQGTALANRTDLWQCYGVYGLTIDCNYTLTSGLLLANYRGTANYVSVHNCMSTGIRSAGITNIRNCKIKGTPAGCTYGIYLDRADNTIDDVEVIDAKTAFYVGGYLRANNANAWLQHSDVFNGSVYMEFPTTYNSISSSIVNSTIDTYQTAFRLGANEMGINLTNVQTQFNTTEVITTNPDTWLFYCPGTNNFSTVNVVNSLIIGIGRVNETQFSNLNAVRFMYDPTTIYYNVSGLRKYILPTFDTVSGITYTTQRGSFDGTQLNMFAHGTSTVAGQVVIATLPDNYSIVAPDLVNAVIGLAFWYDSTSVANWQFNPTSITPIRLAANNTQQVVACTPSGVSSTTLTFDFIINTGTAAVRYRQNSNIN